MPILISAHYVMFSWEDLCLSYSWHVRQETIDNLIKSIFKCQSRAANGSDNDYGS